MSKDVTCEHCGHTGPDWLYSCHDCLWSIWEDGDMEPAGAIWRARNAVDAVTGWAFFDGDRARYLCRNPEAAATVRVRRKNSPEVVTLRLTGHLQPTYHTYVVGKATTARVLRP